MKVYKNQNLASVKSLGFYSNFCFASDSVISPKGVDVTSCRDIMGKYTYEITEYKDGIARISVMSESEYEKWLSTVCNSA